MKNISRLLLVVLCMHVCFTATIMINNSGSCANIRVTPGTSGSIVACLNDGTRLETNGVTKSADGMNWIQVNHAGS